MLPNLTDDDNNDDDGNINDISHFNENSNNSNK